MRLAGERKRQRLRQRDPVLGEVRLPTRADAVGEIPRELLRDSRGCLPAGPVAVTAGPLRMGLMALTLVSGVTLTLTLGPSTDADTMTLHQRGVQCATV